MIAGYVLSRVRARPRQQIFFDITTSAASSVEHRADRQGLRIPDSRNRPRRGRERAIPALLVAGFGVALAPLPAVAADPTSDGIDQLKAEIQK